MLPSSSNIAESLTNTSLTVGPYTWLISASVPTVSPGNIRTVDVVLSTTSRSRHRRLEIADGVLQLRDPSIPLRRWLLERLQAELVAFPDVADDSPKTIDFNIP